MSTTSLAPDPGLGACAACASQLSSLEAAVSTYRWAAAEEHWHVLRRTLGAAIADRFAATLLESRMQNLREAIHGQDAVAFFCFVRGLRAQLQQPCSCVHTGS